MERIGFDLDGVLYSWIGALWTHLRTHRNYEGTEFDLERNFFNILTEEQVSYYASLPILYTTRLPKREDLQTLNRLASKYDIFYITARPESVRVQTLKFLDENKFPFSNNLIMTYHKSTYARLLGLQYFVDDSTEQVRNLAKTTTAFLLDHYYNKDNRGDMPVINYIQELERILL
jgi:uncharacterized HAD superfamily protein